MIWPMPSNIGLTGLTGQTGLASDPDAAAGVEVLTDQSSGELIDEDGELLTDENGTVLSDVYGILLTDEDGEVLLG